ncbi:Rho termination factor N-terminal domain-containing protein [Agromyces indicus]|uniref:Rho termination factor N-terminal domain-containing protein n=1 Tax=Agromyces indicus TaxID=758919 RepID=A0ABU1FJQ1_9MICO|nr:Rho termination factor N-terminal domain-containing protein [Agromyces indicus]MDR5691500.1 Rho termination factor N-terminal domain-containing protein [Agromyces indicus]
MADQPGNQTPNTPEVSETELRDLNVDDLRERAKDAGVSGASNMNKEELVEAVAKASSNGGSGGGGSGDDQDLGAGPDGGRVRRGPESSTSIDYSQEVTSTDDDPEREGRSLVTTHHEVIRQWAEERDGTPATVPGTEHEGRLGVLRIDFGADDDRLEKVTWERWFETFDERGLNFIYQETRSDGSQSNFFRLENPNREDA